MTLSRKFRSKNELKAYLAGLITTYGKKETVSSALDQMLRDKKQYELFKKENEDGFKINDN